ncbi:Cupin domain-containing protein [Marininema mesophilum]|uniref:Cupin domain-containing protein n=1 Tax=Marininema mesophilum TaxID=1048340 RepID=A0A1H3C4E0_9BACL|nr:cupin domain-containing protein [Marininema mesophilum]SDX49042.1 Cupin domain-containing protein [Marininema mesophilum]
MPWIFTYGISTDTNEMKRDIGEFHSYVCATLRDYIYAFTGEHPEFGNKGTSTILPLTGGHVLGVAYQVNQNKLEDLVTNGHGYEFKKNTATIEGKEVEVFTLQPKEIKQLNPPTDEYLKMVESGLKSHYHEEIVDLYLSRALKRTVESEYSSIDRQSNAKFKSEYGTDFRRVFPIKASNSSPFGSGWAILPPSERTTPHNHDEEEAFIFLKGEGTMSVDGKEFPVSRGDIVYLEPFSVHTVTNNGSGNMEILCIWWGEVSS